MERKIKRNRFPRKGKLGWFSAFNDGSDENKGNPAVNAAKFNDAMTTNGPAPTSGAMGEGVVLHEADEEVVDDTKENTKETGGEVSAQEKEEFEKLLDELKGLGYEEYVNALNNMKDDQKKLFQACFGKVDTRNVKVTKESIPVKNLFPTQNEIDVTKSLSWLFVGGDIFGKTPKTPDNPDKTSIAKSFANTLGKPTQMSPGGGYIITYNGKYIIDGHHRWSQAYCADANGSIVSVNFQYSTPPKDKEGTQIGVLKDFQGAIFAETGKVPSATTQGNKYNVFDMTDSAIADFIKQYMSNYTVQVLSGYDKVTGISVKSDDGKLSRKKAAGYFYGNVMALRQNNKPIKGKDAPARGFMPQTDTLDIPQDVNPPTAMSEEYDDDISEMFKYLRR